MADRPNIVLCICDQLRAFEVGCYGNPVIRTPHVDRLGREGVRFDLAVTNYPVCMAARSVLLSGQYNRTCTGGVSNVHYPRGPGSFLLPEYPASGRPHLPAQTLPEALRALGYTTQAIGKWHIHSWPHDIGFDHYVIPRVPHCHTGQSFTEDGGPEFVPAGYSVDFEAERVERFLRRQQGANQPFFLYYSISPPHCPLADAPEYYRAMYRPAEIPLRPNVDLSQPLAEQDHWLKVYRWDFRYYNLHLPHTEQLPAGYGWRECIAEYYGMTTWMDACVGRMLAALDHTGLADRTIVVFTSDHGDNLGSLGLVQKGGPNEESVRIPLVVRYPGVLAPGVVTEAVASLVDVAPTLLDLAGGAFPDHMAGQSLAPVLHDPSASLPRAHAYVETGGGVALRTPSHMAFVPRDPVSGDIATAATQFYDLDADPYEMHNLAPTNLQGTVRREMEDLIREWDRATPWMPAH